MKYILNRIIYMLPFVIWMNALPSMAQIPTLKYIVNAFVKITTTDGKIIYIDPYEYNQTDSADVVLITHEHSDHNQLSRVPRKASCQVIRSSDALVSGVYKSFTIGAISIQAVPAYDQWHSVTICVGYVVKVDGIKIYHGGDTGQIPEMADLASQNISYALLPMYIGASAMTQAGDLIQAKRVIPVHTSYPNLASYDTALVSQYTSTRKLALKLGQTIELTQTPTSRISSTLLVPLEFSNIQGAIDAAQPLDTVLVSEGVYYETIKFRGKGILVASKFYITNNWQTVFNTIIDGSTASNKDTASTVQFLWSEDSTAVLDGFTIRGGSGTKYMFPYGTGTYAYQEGAGIVLHYSSAIICNNYITNNMMVPVGTTANGGGGGIASMYGKPCIYNNIIANNTSGYAGGIVLNWSGGNVKNNIIYHNTAIGQFGGGGLMIWKVPANTVFAENNTIVDNHSAASGGGIILNLLDASSIPVIRNNIIWANTQANGMQFTLAQHGTYNDVQDYSGGKNISIDPQFLSGNNFMLSSSSPCIDAGDTAVICNDREDLANNGYAFTPSQGGLRNDIGVYGGCLARSLPIFSTTKVKDNPCINYNYQLLQNYPNPFNPTTTIGYRLSSATKVSLNVYDVLGRKVMTLVDAMQFAGNHTVPFDASNLSSGIYLYQLNAGNYVETKKLMLMK